MHLDQLLFAVWVTEVQVAALCWCHKAIWMDSIWAQKEVDLRKEINTQSNSPGGGHKTVTGILAAKALVFCIWRVWSLCLTMKDALHPTQHLWSFGLQCGCWWCSLISSYSTWHRYVCCVELLIKHREHSGSRAVCACVSVCRSPFRFCQLCV